MTDGKCGLPRGSRKRVVADRLGAAVSSGSSAPFLVEKMRISAINIFCRSGLKSVMPVAAERSLNYEKNRYCDGV